MRPEGYVAYRRRLFPPRIRLAIRAAALIAAYPGRFTIHFLSQELCDGKYEDSCSKSQLSNLISLMSYIFGELMEDDDGNLYWYEPGSREWEGEKLTKPEIML